MICKNCNTEISDTAFFCPKCGYELSKDRPATHHKSKYGDIVIIIFSIFLMFNKIFWYSHKFLGLNSTSAIQLFNMFINLFFAAVPLCFAFMVKNKIWRLILIISGVVYALISLASAFSSYNYY